jgi:hypothetical protein
MPLLRGSTKELTLQRLSSRVIADATAGVRKPAQPDGRRAAQQVGKLSLRIAPFGFLGLRLEG